MRQYTTICVVVVMSFQVLLNLFVVQGFVIDSHLTARPSSPLSSSLILRASSSSHNENSNDGDSSGGVWSRRSAIQAATISGVTAAASGLIGNPMKVQAATDDSNSGYIPAIRPTAYRVDSTQPPTLIPLDNASKQIGVLLGLGKGSGTDKNVIVDDSINLNNILNKAVFGTIDTINGIIGPKQDSTTSGPGYASFLCMGVPTSTEEKDIELASGLLDRVLQARKGNSALGIWFCPLSSQSDLDSYLQSGDEMALSQALERKGGVGERTMSLYSPLFRNARSKGLKLLALAPEPEDVITARKGGLQQVNPDRREDYVPDTEGFIALSQDPKFRVYSERSLLKDFNPTAGNNKDETIGNYFSERILVHETAATAVAKYAYDKPDSFVAMIAPTPDVRFLQGMNGRIPRICQFLNPTGNLVTENAVTTILLNPTAAETLSKSRYLRLEVGTGPDTIDYQSKVADYLWFSSSPKVNLIPRLMNG